MKFIFMLLILFVLTDPALAKPADNTSECLNMYHTYMNDYGASRLIPDQQMLNFIDRCLPTYSDEPHQQKLLQIIDDNRKIMTVKA